ncbi:hypothetical protein ACHAXT_004185 [Thalassiosira profunda]
MVRVLPTLAVLVAALSAATAFVPAPAVRHSARYFAGEADDVGGPVDATDDFVAASFAEEEVEDIAEVPVVKEEANTIKSKTSGPDFTKLADEIQSAFKKIFSGPK